MNKNYEEELKCNDFEEIEDNTTEINVVEKESLWTKTKKKISAIGDLTVRDVIKGGLKVGATIGGAAIIVGGTIKLLGNKEDDIVDVTILSEENIEEGDVISDVEVETE